MSKELFFLISVVIAVALAAPAAAGAPCNILADPDFELGGAGWDIWTWAAGKAAIESDPAIQLNGNYLRASRPGSGGAGAAQQFSASEGDVLCIEGWVRTSVGATGVCAAFTVAWGDPNYDPSQNNFLRRDESWMIGEPLLTGEILAWTFVRMETPPAPAGTVIVRIECFNNLDGDGHAYFDEISACWDVCPNVKAKTPNPANGSVGVSRTPTLSWSPGVDANSHDVYLGTGYNDVNDATTSSAEYQVNQAFDVNSYGPGLLELGQTYYWRIDEVNESWVSGPIPPVNDRWKGDVWSFTVSAIVASQPSPSDGKGDVHRYYADLSWVWGADVNSHDVYFGTDYNDVNDANNSLPVGTSVYKGNQPRVNTSYDPGFLELGETYYWRIDEVNEFDPNIWKGDVWSFTVSTSTNVLVNPGFEDGTGSDPWNEGLMPDLWNNITWGNSWAAWKSDSAQSTFLSHSGDKLYAVGGGDESGAPSWSSGAGVYQDTPVGVIEVNDIVVVSVWARTEAWGTPISSLKVEFKDVNGVVIRADESIIINGEQKSAYEKYTVVTNPAPAGTSYAEFIVLGGSFGTILVDDASLDVGLPVIAWDPSPQHGATSVGRDADLSWLAGIDANSHDVYFGTSFAEVNDANTSSAEFKSSQPLADANYEPGILDLTRTYYWRIDEVNEPNLWKGEVWSFTTGEFAVVDDFDSYADTTALEAVWTTGHLTNNGAEFFLETIPDYVRDGRSMRYYFRNIYKFQNKFVGSEAEADTTDLEVGTDWVSGGVEAMVLYFYGDATNLGDTSGVVGGIHQDQMYVALEDGSSNVGIVKWPDMNAIKEAEWHEWNIDLEDPCLANVNMANVAKVYIGFGGQKTGQSEAGAGKVSGKGDTVWFDDIMLYIPRCVAAISLAEGDFTGDCVIDWLDLDIMGGDWLARDYNVVAAAQNDANLVAWYKFEDNFNDSSVNSNNGTPHGGTSFVSGVDGNAISLDGLGDYVSIPDSNTPGGVFDINDTITVSAWIKVTTFDKWFQTIIAKGDDSWRLARYQDTDWLEFACSGLSGGAEPPFGNVIGRISVNDNQWHHVAGVYDGSKVYLYIDGLLDNREEATGAINSSSYNVWIGANEEMPDREWNGLIDDVRIYNRSLSHAEMVGFTGQSEVYQPVLSPANISDKEAKFFKSVNFKDYAIMANRWLEQLLFPFE